MADTNMKSALETHQESIIVKYAPEYRLSQYPAHFFVDSKDMERCRPMLGNVPMDIRNYIQMLENTVRTVDKYNKDSKKIIGNLRDHVQKLSENDLKQEKKIKDLGDKHEQLRQTLASAQHARNTSSKQYEVNKKELRNDINNLNNTLEATVTELAAKTAELDVAENLVETMGTALAEKGAELDYVEGLVELTGTGLAAKSVALETFKEASESDIEGLKDKVEALEWECLIVKWDQVLLDSKKAKYPSWSRVVVPNQDTTMSLAVKESGIPAPPTEVIPLPTKPKASGKYSIPGWW